MTFVTLNSPLSLYYTPPKIIDFCHTRPPNPPAGSALENSKSSNRPFHYINHPKKQNTRFARKLVLTERTDRKVPPGRFN